MIKLKDLIKSKTNPRLGLCYVLSGRYVSSHPKSVLVHGELINKFTIGNPKVDHAWVEEGDEIFDPVMNRRFPKAVYEGIFQPVSHKKYSHMDVITITSKTGNWGPWDEHDTIKPKDLSEVKFRKSNKYIHLVDLPMFSIYANVSLDKIKLEEFKKTNYVKEFSVARDYIHKIGFPSMHANVIISDLSSEINQNTGGRVGGQAVSYKKFMELDINSVNVNNIIHEWAHLWMMNNSKIFKKSVNSFYAYMLKHSTDNITKTLLPHGQKDKIGKYKKDFSTTNSYELNFSGKEFAYHRDIMKKLNN